MKMLSDSVQVQRRFQRSVRIDMDLESVEALQGFVIHGSVRTAMETMARLSTESRQRAFTWTGPYGGGKSSLALALCAAIGKDANLQQLARKLLADISLGNAFPARDDRWLVVPVVGRRSNPIVDIREALAKAVASEPGRARTHRRKAETSGRDIIDRLVAEADKRSESGVVVFVDEMGKYLEDLRASGGDIHFFQELAEAAGRCRGRLIVVGILHQSFEQYASGLGREAQEEWSKVQGRFVDIPIVTAIDEVVDLLGRAIATQIPPSKNLQLAQRVAHAVRKRRPASPADLASRIAACWPLHPVSALLLGPISRCRFGQNERSVFGFLGSNEPVGFQEFLKTTPKRASASYDPGRLWEYLRVNFEPAILSSADGHRWAQAVEAVERSESRGTPMHVRLAKTIALIDLFGNGSGLVPERAVLGASLADVSTRKLDQALADLETWSVTIFRRHLEAWATYAGSDFDITEAVNQAKASSPGLDLTRLSRLAALRPIPAKRHYYRTGALRWFETRLVEIDEAPRFLQRFRLQGGAAGLLLLAIPQADEPEREVKAKCRDASKLARNYPFATGIPNKGRIIRELGAELLALESVQRNRPELEGDSVARREIGARIASIASLLEEELSNAFYEASWYVCGRMHTGEKDHPLSQLVSMLADEAFADSPVVRSELVNRERPSSNSQAAVRQLLYAMAANPTQEHLGISGFPAERGLYSTVLEVSSLHAVLPDGRFGFQSPQPEHPVGRSFVPMWSAAEEALRKAEAPVSLGRLYEDWASPPFGVRRGLLPILAMAFIQSHRSNMAIYLDGIFQPEVTDLVVDRILQGERAVHIRSVNPCGQNEQILRDLVRYLSERLDDVFKTEPLDVARALVHFVFRLPPWARRTRSLSREAESVRRILLKANDPHRTLFVDLPLVFDGVPTEEIGNRVASALEELDRAFPCMLDDLRDRMFRALGLKDGDLMELRRRAKTVLGVSGDLKLDALAQRLSKVTGGHDEMEAIAGLAVSKPVRDWSDNDPNRAAVALAELALRFRRVEALARVKDREPTQHAIAVVCGTGEQGRTILRNLTVSDADRSEVSRLAAQVTALLRSLDADHDLILAALAEAAMSAMQDSLAIAASEEEAAAS